MRLAGFAVLTVFAALGLAAPASAAVLYSTGFEAPTFTTGALNGRGGWGVVGDSSVVNVENTVAFDGAQAVEVGISGISGPYYTYGPITPTGPITVSAEIQIDADAIDQIFAVSTGPAFTDLTAGVNFLTEGLSGPVIVQDEQGASSTQLATLSRGVWYDVSLTLDYPTQTYDISIDGQVIGANLPFCGGMPTSSTCDRNHISQFGDVEFLVGGKYFKSYIDNVSISTPEPAAWALMLTGYAGLGAAFRSRRRRSLRTPATA